MEDFQIPYYSLDRPGMSACINLVCINQEDRNGYIGIYFALYSGIVGDLI